MSLIEAVPTFDGSATLEQFRASYDSAQCVCFKQVNNNVRTANSKKRKRSSDAHPQDFLKVILDTFVSATSKDQASWTIENEHVVTSTTLPSDFLSPLATQNGYCSFVLQDKSTVDSFTEKNVSHPTLPLTATTAHEISDSVFVSSPFWLFVGRNNSSKPMQGRSEHTDSVHHDGTFHYQVVGSKTWNCRPTDELRAKCDELDIALKDTYTHTVEEGDLFLMNTRLWWHQTEIPAESGLSISYARDIYLDGSQPVVEDHMSSVDGSWATLNFQKGTVLCSLSWESIRRLPIGRSNEAEKANCELIDNDDDSDDEQRMSLVTTKDIKEGEFFIILESEHESEHEY
jgi:hypothetical protein